MKRRESLINDVVEELCIGSADGTACYMVQHASYATWCRNAYVGRSDGSKEVHGCTGSFLECWQENSIVKLMQASGCSTPPPPHSRVSKFGSMHVGCPYHAQTKLAIFPATPQGHVYVVTWMGITSHEGGRKDPAEGVFSNFWLHPPFSLKP